MMRSSLLALLLTSLLWGAAASAQSANPVAMDKPETLPEAYPDAYIFGQFTRHTPAAPNRDELRPGQLNYGISYSRHLADNWVAGVGYRVKSFIRANDQSLALLSLSNHTQRIFRVYHPVYLLLGTEWSYMIPTTRVTVPIIKDPDYATEIGVGLSASLWWFLRPDVPIEFRILRWRGTKTNRLHGWESTVSAGYAF